MRAFIILCCLATAYAASLGYEYERQSGVGAGPGGFPSAGFVGAPSVSFGGAPSVSFGGAPSGGFGGAPSAGYNGDQGFQAGPANSNDYSAPAADPAEFEKEFFTFSAPEGAFDDNGPNQQLSNAGKRGLRVIFIKGPENSGLENAALQLAKNAGEQRTAIYVLNKQADIGDLANKLNVLNKNNANKPEVHFVKYRTPADAENAQRAIQNQYDSLGGKSNSHNGGVAPVLDFASKAPLGGNTEHAGAYLPPNHRV